jgi:membrane-associated phospholipid phosphatase
VARAISAIIHPVVVPLATLGILTYLAHGSLTDAARLVVVAVAIGIVPIGVLVLVQVARGQWTDMDVSVRRQRYILYPLGIACMLAAVFSFVELGAPSTAIRAAVGLVAANVLNSLINFGYKVSAHATTAALCAAVLWLATPVSLIGVAAAAAALLVGWSRVALGRHTGGQVVLGWAVGLICGAVAMLAPWPLVVPARLMF